MNLTSMIEALRELLPVGHGPRPADVPSDLLQAMSAQHPVEPDLGCTEQRPRRSGAG